MPDEYDVAVVGGGATGVGVARDLALRGVDVALFERGGLAAGTTGRSHCLLHSGARYADEDPESARHCRRENRTLRRIAGACVDETGGLFVQLGADSDAYFDRKLAACREADIPTAVVDGDRARRYEPGLSTAVERAIVVPDAVVRPSRLVAATAASAQAHGARVETHAEVTDVDAGDDGAALRVDGDRIDAAHVVNAAGAWAGEVAALAGAPVEMRPTAGAMAVAEPAPRRVVNRCRPTDDGDIVVPLAGKAVLGTTSREVADPDDLPADPAERDTLVAECSAMLPALDRDAVERVYRGVRPLYDPGTTETDDSRSVTRGFALLDHRRDGLPGLTTVVGGKLTTHRLMAEAVADHVCARLGVEAPCRTADRPLPGHADPARLDEWVETFDARAPAGGAQAQ